MNPLPEVGQGLATVADCLLEDCLRVTPEARYRDFAPGQDSERVFVVMDGERFLGLVSLQQATLFPNRLFADLLVTRQPPPLRPEDSLEHALDRLEAEDASHMAVVDAQGRFVGVTSRLLVFRCLRDRERLLHARLQSTVRLLEEELTHHRIASMVFDTTSEGIMVTDADRTILLVNRAFSRTTGYAPDEVIGQKPSLLASGRHDAAFYASMWKSLSQTGHWSGEIWNRRKNGEIYPEYLHIDVIRGKDGRPLRYVGVFSDMTEDRQLQARLYDLAFHDPLTGLPNRALFDERLKASINHAQRTDSPFALLYLDLDRFKVVNDTLGHTAGDEVLRQVARRLREALRETDTAARLGGDEFAVILCSVREREGILTVVRKLLASLRRPVQVSDREIWLDASVGIAHFPDHGDSAEKLMQHADTALYAAKSEAGPRWCFYEPGMGRRAHERLELEGALRSALETGEGLHLAWQPQVDMATHKPRGLEALARWTHPTLGPVSPARFIPLVEDAGLAVRFTGWLIEAFCADIATLPHALRTGLRFALNVSARALHAAQQWLPLLDEGMQRLGLAPHQIDVEITESSLMDEDRHAAPLLALRERGFQISVDDFGTGYSNLGYLMRFSVDRLKIDMSLIDGIALNHTSRQIVTAILRMAEALEVEVVAEGVETGAQRRILAELGCHEAQGYYFARPMAMNELARLLEDQTHPH